MCDWDDVIREKIEADIAEDLCEKHIYCSNCGEEITDYEEAYYEIDEVTTLCESCLEECRRFVG